MQAGNWLYVLFFTADSVAHDQDQEDVSVRVWRNQIDADS
jgi:hypothetical protein